MHDNWLETIGVAVESRRITAGVTHYVPASINHRLGVHVGAAVNASCNCDGKHHRRVQSDGDIDIVPAGLDGDWQDDADCTILRLWVSPALIRRAAEDLEIDPDRVVIRPQFQRRDPRIEHIARALATGLSPDVPSDRVYFESLARALAVRVIQGAASRPDVRAMQALSPGQKHRLADFIEAKLDQDLSLDELAQVAAISVSHLKVLFRRTFGMPPHRYVIHRRVERAKTLLHQGKMPLSEIALEAGFAHQSHMAQSMKRILGVTPGVLIRMRR
ncbi:helix-turn-helix domain-containing protein [Mesorhizobium erdmanii]|uniref:AraC family transcriptional regulator n=1 Tax=Mesorhizobium erdmanii TaxID=1777866 RepID=A0A6M7US71_9HYPH|nr:MULTISPECIES: AraC family transcriptional regulator [Mesorhizobium]OBQ75452.1 transcriptional regulator [Mesorhizobium loti]QKC79894.1 AraC family transcriptional regulator [Mesorhizobium erdmanii]